MASSRGTSLATILIITLCSATISVLFSVEVSHRNVSFTSLTNCICSEQISRKPTAQSAIREQRHAEAGQVTVTQEDPVSLPRNTAPSHESVAAAIQPSRKRHMRNMCQKTLPVHQRERLRVSSETLKHLYVNDEHKIIYCSVPKAGCTNWKRILLALENSSLSVPDISRDAAHHNHLRTLYDYSESQRSQMLKQYTKFIFTRDPFVRLLSAYKDKFQKIRNLACERHSSYFKKMAGKIMSQYRSDVPLSTLEAGEGVTWLEFVRHIIDTPDRLKMNEHWQSAHTLCAPCNIDYNYIGKLETVHEDSSRLFKKLFNDSQRFYYPKFAEPTVRSSAEFNSAFGEITIKQLQQLWSIYEIDFLLFNYTRPDFMKSSVT
ncbi:carbohydrate sulfotransferase 11-like [Diadema setosum]|uniref:carbohydrate sulfotransferase 11-like n=1 Tax=Diadema setosum TaxID=31175 RepID=UPI003B3AF7D3